MLVLIGHIEIATNVAGGGGEGVGSSPPHPAVIIRRMRARPVGTNFGILTFIGNFTFSFIYRDIRAFRFSLPYTA
jgi:hypothetical protein